MPIQLDDRRGRRRVRLADSAYEAIDRQCNLVEAHQIAFRSTYDSIPQTDVVQGGGLIELATEFAVFEEGLVLADVLPRPQHPVHGASVRGLSITDLYATHPMRTKACIVYGGPIRVRCFMLIDGNLVPKEMSLVTVIDHMRGFVHRLSEAMNPTRENWLNAAAAAA